MIRRDKLFNIWFALKIVFCKAPFVASGYLIFALTGAAFTALQVVFLENLIDQVYLIADGTNMKSVILSAFFYIASVFLSQIYTFTMSKMGRYLSRELTLKLSPEILDNLERIEYCFFEDTRFNDVMNKMGDNPQQMIHNAFFSVVTSINSVMKLVGILLVFFRASFSLGIGALLLGIPMAIIEVYSTDKQQKLNRENTPEKRKEKNIQDLIEDKNAILEFKVFDCFSYLITYWREIRELIKNRQKGITKRTIFFRAVICVMKIAYVSFVIVFLGSKLLAHLVTIGTFISIVTSVEKMYGILNTASYSLSTLGARTYDISYYRQFLAFDKRSSGSKLLKNSDYDIEFKNVHFSYPGVNEEVLKGISFKVEHGRCTALVGVNGAGKSTIIKLLCGLYKPTAGEILIDGINISDLAESELHKVCSVVFQDYGKYELTLRENVALGNIPLIQNDEKLHTVLKTANFYEEDIDLDQKLGHLFKNGRELSGGQWQKVAIARTLLSASDFLIMDEPTAALDPVAESRMYDTFTELTKGRGAVIISHRLASAKMADNIVVIENGKVVESGSHSFLMNIHGKYAEMFEMQRAWYEESCYE